MQFIKSRATLTTMAWLLIAVLAVVIALLTLLPVPSGLGVKSADKVYHLVAFGALAVPLAVAYPRHLIYVFLFAVSYGVLIEFLQPMTGRAFEIGDIVADALGAGLGCALGWTLRRRTVLRTL